jgi:hypothetical protein
VILGHLIPAGTAYSSNLNLRLKYLVEQPRNEVERPSPQVSVTIPRLAPTPSNEPVGI